MPAAPRHIVCIDDDHNILDLNKQLLESLGGYHVTCFDNGPDGIRAIGERRPDLVLLDMMMPGMDGISVLQQLRNNPQTRLVPVIFMTAQKTPSDVKKYMDMGALSVITKPIDIEDFPFQMEMLSKIIMNN